MEARGERTLLVGGLPVARDRDEARVAQVVERAQALGQLITVDDGQSDVEQCGVEGARRGELQRLRRVVRQRDVATAKRERGGEHLGGVDVVVYDQHPTAQRLALGRWR